MGTGGLRRLRAVGRGSVLALFLLSTARTGVGADDAASKGPVWTPYHAGLESTGISSLRIQGRNADEMFAFVHGLGIARSKDEGQTWEVIQEGIDPKHVPGPRDPVEITLDSKEDKLVWVVTKGNVYFSEDGGEHWQNRSSGALVSRSWDRRESEMLIRGVAVDPKKSLHVLAGTRTGGRMRGGLFETSDGGKTWEQIAGDDVQKSELGCDAWPIVLDPRTDKNVGVGGERGFWFSDDRGRHFKPADIGDVGIHVVHSVTELTSRSKELVLCDARGLWKSRDGGKHWDKKPVLEGDCQFAAQSPWSRSLVFAVLRGRGLVSSEDGRNAKWDSRGNEELEIREILFDPRDKDRIFFASPSTGLYVSKDDGVSIAPVKGNAPVVVPAVVAVAHHPTDVDHLLAATDQGVLFVSGDRGESWKRAGRLGMVPTRLLGLPASDSTWLAAGRRLLRSPDHGATWEKLYEPEDPEERVVDVARVGDGGLAILLERSRTVLASKDGGRTWETSKPPTKTADAWASSLAVDGTNPAHLLMATRTLADSWTGKDHEGGPFESWDGGKTWKPIAEGLLSVKEPKRDWNRGRLALIDRTAGVMLYAADGLGLFARSIVPPDDKSAEAAGWVDVSPSLPHSVVDAWTVLAPEQAGGPGELVLQVDGENETRLIARASLARLAARASGQEAAATPGAPALWTSMPDPGTRLACLDADPHLHGRLVGADAVGTAGVLVFGVPGQRPAEEEKPSGAATPVPGPSQPAHKPPPSGLLAFTAGSDGQVRVWNLAEGKVLKSLNGHTDEVYAVALAPDESVVATGGADKSVRVWDAADGKERQTLDPKEYDAKVNALAFAPDSKTLYVAMEESWAIVQWNLETQERHALEGHTAGVLALALTPDGSRLVSAGRDRTIRVWDPADPASSRRIDAGIEVLCLAVSPDGKRVYAGGRGASVRVFDLAEAKQVGAAEVMGEYVSDLALDPEGKRLYVAGDKGLAAVDAATLAPVEGPAAGRYEGPSKAVFSVAVTQDGGWVVAGDSESGLWLWATDEAKPYWSSTTAHAGSIHDVVLTPDVAQAKPGEGGAPAPAPPDGDPPVPPSDVPSPGGS